MPRGALCRFIVWLLNFSQRSLCEGLAQPEAIWELLEPLGGGTLHREVGPSECVPKGILGPPLFSCLVSFTSWLP